MNSKQVPSTSRKMKIRRVKKDVSGPSRAIAALMLESYVDLNRDNLVLFQPSTSKSEVKVEVPKRASLSSTLTVEDFREIRHQIRGEAENAAEKLEEDTVLVKEEIKKLKISPYKNEKAEEILKKSKNISNFIKQRKLYLKFLEEKQGIIKLENVISFRIFNHRPFLEVIGIVRSIHNEMCEYYKNLRNKFEELNDIWKEKDYDDVTSPDLELIIEENPHELFHLFDAVMLEMMKSHIPKWSPNGQHSRIRKYFEIRSDKEKMNNKELLSYKHLKDIGRNFCDRILRIVNDNPQYDSSNYDSSDAISENDEPRYRRPPKKQPLKKENESPYDGYDEDISANERDSEIESRPAPRPKKLLGNEVEIVRLPEFQINGNEDNSPNPTFALSALFVTLLKIGPISLTALMDTGAQRSLIARRALDRLPKTEIFSSECVLRTTNLVEIETFGEVEYEIQFGRGRKVCSFLVLEMHSNDLLLGMDFFRAVKATINIGLNIVEFFAQDSWHVVRAINGTNEDVEEVREYIQRRRRGYMNHNSGLQKKKRSRKRKMIDNYEPVGGKMDYAKQLWALKNIFITDELLQEEDEDVREAKKKNDHAILSKIQRMRKGQK